MPKDPGRRRAVALLAGLALSCAMSLMPETRAMAATADPHRDVLALFTQAQADGRVGTARKTKPVDARPATVGEVITTVIKDEGKETQSRPAADGDMVVRNRCEATGNETYLVSKNTFAKRYEVAAAATGADGWREYTPTGPLLEYFLVGDGEGAFTFTAPWGEAMVARPGDAIVQNPEKREDTYRVARASFECTYEVLAKAAGG